MTGSRRAIWLLLSCLLQAQDTTAATFTVTTTSNAGPGSLRTAILDANASNSEDEIRFAIPGDGPHVIHLGQPLPVITLPVRIDGYSQPGSRENSSDVGSNAIVSIHLNGDAIPSGTAMIRIDSDDVRLRGLLVRGRDPVPFTTLSRPAVEFVASTVPRGGGRIEGCFIGIDGADEPALRNDGPGIVVGAGHSVTIGGPLLTSRNLISGNRDEGIRIDSAYASLIENNLIGVGPDALTPLGNGRGGVRVTGAASDIAIIGNIVANNTGSGIRVSDDARSVTITANRIFGNSALGIDLTGAIGVTANDFLDADTGANGLQNFPELIEVRTIAFDPPQTRVRGRLHSTPNQPFTIELFRNNRLECDSSGHGQGRTPLSLLPTLVTDASGNAAFDTVLPIALPGAVTVAATATAADGSTSEFSACRTAGAGPLDPIFGHGFEPPA